ncbi:MAG: disulfide bond formation protein B, partial [Alphaproteobacteria bacterium]|nr:disulfide bond formation protein B [Alphaproteobacteria bacterium]
AEWGFWAAPSTCAGVEELSSAGGGLLNAIRNAEIVDCAKPALIILGLSLAGWNAIISLCLSIGSLKAAFYASEGA